jgi:DNA primase
MAGWVSFAQIKAVVSLRRVLEDYGVWEQLRRSGKEHYRGACPIHQGEGQDAFHGDMRKNVFHCFSCGAGGNVLDLVACLEQCSVREAALQLQQRYLMAGCTVPPRRKWPEEAQLVTKKRRENAVLPFHLSGLDEFHPYVSRRGLSPETASHFGIGYYRGPGIMSGRLVIPIQDEAGQLVAYCGRSITSKDSRYRFPVNFRKSSVLFNYHRAAAFADENVIVVEGFFDAMRVHQAGFPSVVALMGAALSQDQENLLMRRFRRVKLMLDGDPAGQAASANALKRLARRCDVRQVTVGPSRQPDEMSDQEIRQALGKNVNDNQRLFTQFA